MKRFALCVLAIVQDKNCILSKTVEQFAPESSCKSLQVGQMVGREIGHRPFSAACCRSELPQIKKKRRRVAIRLVHLEPEDAPLPGLEIACDQSSFAGPRRPGHPKHRPPACLIENLEQALSKHRLMQP